MRRKIAERNQAKYLVEYPKVRLFEDGAGAPSYLVSLTLMRTVKTMIEMIELL